LKVSLIIPAYNEAKQIRANLEVLRDVRTISEIIVVDDGSSDDLHTIVAQFSRVKIVAHDKNRGKFQAVSTGVKCASSEIVAFYDADLTGMQPEYVENMIAKFKEGYDMVIMDKGSQPWIFRKLIRSLPAQSGTRIMWKNDFFAIDFGRMRSFDLEPKLTRYGLENDLRIGFVEAARVRDPRKFIKYSFLRGAYLDLRTIWQVFTCDGILGIPGVLSDMWKIEKMYQLGIDRPSQIKPSPRNLAFPFIQKVKALIKRYRKIGEHPPAI